MFGLIKESVFDKLEAIHESGNETEFKQGFNEYFTKIKSDKDLRDIYEIYDLFTHVSFEDKELANQFIEESLNFLNSCDKSKINLLNEKYKDIISTLDENSVEYILDKLIFEKTSIKDKVLYKSKLSKMLVGEVKDKSEITHIIENKQSKIEENVSKLSDPEKNILDLFVENDKQKIDNFYKTIISEAETLVENKITYEENSDVIKKLIEVKKKINLMKKESPDITKVENILNLKSDLL